MGILNLNLLMAFRHLWLILW